MIERRIAEQKQLAEGVLEGKQAVLEENSRLRQELLDSLRGLEAAQEQLQALRSSHAQQLQELGGKFAAQVRDRTG